jgi:hypothetical protein
MGETGPLMHAGGCNCGAVRYVARGEPVIVAHCHCLACQRASGAGHATGALFPSDAVTIDGKLSEYKYRSDRNTEVTRAFCPECGSHIYGCNTGMPGYFNITLGTMDDPTDLVPQVAVFGRSRRPWDLIDASVVAFDAQPDWKPSGKD